MSSKLPRFPFSLLAFEDKTTLSRWVNILTARAAQGNIKKGPLDLIKIQKTAYTATKPNIAKRTRYINKHKRFDCVYIFISFIAQFIRMSSRLPPGVESFCLLISAPQHPELNDNYLFLSTKGNHFQSKWDGAAPFNGAILNLQSDSEYFGIKGDGYLFDTFISPVLLDPNGEFQSGDMKLKGKTEHPEWMQCPWSFRDSDNHLTLGGEEKFLMCKDGKDNYRLYWGDEKPDCVSVGLVKKT